MIAPTFTVVGMDWIELLELTTAGVLTGRCRVCPGLSDVTNYRCDVFSTNRAAPRYPRSRRAAASSSAKVALVLVAPLACTKSKRSLPAVSNP